MAYKNLKIAVVIPCYKVSGHILDVIDGIGHEIDNIYVIDDCCPEGTGSLVKSSRASQRINVICTSENEGVGGAVMMGYQAAIADGMDVIVKIDGDGQMDPDILLDFVDPIAEGRVDYTKGNRFFDLEEIHAMPKIRLFGNAILSLMTKLSSGYWDLFDSTNGYTAIHSNIAKRLPFKKISRRYFFETDMLFHLNIMRAVVMDIPMSSRYGDERSNLKIPKIIGEFFFKHVRNFSKRIFYNYYLRDMSIASIELPLGIIMFSFGIIFGGYQWASSVAAGVAAPAGTVMLSALPVMIGLQFILAFLGHDIRSIPTKPLHNLRKNK